MSDYRYYVGPHNDIDCLCVTIEDSRNAFAQAHIPLDDIQHTMQSVGYNVAPKDEALVQNTPSPIHEHTYVITTENWEYAQRTFTLRYCPICGLTHRLTTYTNGAVTWKPVPVETLPVDEDTNE